MSYRLTKKDVYAVAALAEKLSNGAFCLGYTRGDTDGTVYVDGIRHALAWRGRNGGVHAFAYYYGVCEVYNAGTIGELPVGIRETVSAIRSRPGFMKWLNEGHSEANAKAEVDGKCLCRPGIRCRLHILP